MGIEDASDAARLALLVARRGLRGTLARIHGGAVSRWRDMAGAAERVVIAPQDLRTSDPTIAADIYAGRFAFAGHAVTAGGRSPFREPVPSRLFAQKLHGFGWLRHLRASGKTL